jgi:hypothetical protein
MVISPLTPGKSGIMGMLRVNDIASRKPLVYQVPKQDAISGKLMAFCLRRKDEL